MWMPCCEVWHEQSLTMRPETEDGINHWIRKHRAADTMTNPWVQLTVHNIYNEDPCLNKCHHFQSSLYHFKCEAVTVRCQNYLFYLTLSAGCLYFWCPMEQETARSSNLAGTITVLFYPVMRNILKGMGELRVLNIKQNTEQYIK